MKQIPAGRVAFADVAKKAKGERHDREPDNRDEPLSGRPRSGKRPRLWRKPIRTWGHRHNDKDRQYDAL